MTVDANNEPASAPCSDPGAWQPYVLLDDNTGSGAPSALYRDAVEIIQADEPHEVAGALARLEAARQRGLHAAGFFAYELGYVLEPRLAHLMPEKRKVPLIWFGLFTAPNVMGSVQVEAWLAAQPQQASPRLTDISHSWSGPQYEERFAKVAEYIKAGDIYQMNLTFRARFKLEGTPLALYRELRQKQRVAYGGIIETGQVTILSASPELFIEQAGRVVSTRPMKGTSPRGASEEADEEAKRVLASDTKQRAENLMIVDLMRNDLGRISDIGSVHVTDLFTVETFKTLHQMTSGVTATVVTGTSLAHLLEAIFPPGSVTGAPKIRAMELIAGLEDSPRGVYCGAIGRISPDGHSLFNVAIRTPVFFPDGRGEMGIGSGVVADSGGVGEYAECLLKMKFLTDKVRKFELIETLLFDPTVGATGAYWLLDGHMARLQRSAAHFGFKCDLVQARAALAQKAAGSQHLRVRLLLSEDGTVTVAATPIALPVPGAEIRYVVSPTRVDSAEPFLAHKTTERQLYDREWQHFHDTAGADEVVYLNERGELAEGSRTTIFIERDGVLLTPPLNAGALPGVLRAQLVAQGRAVEQTLTLADLEAAEVVYLGNSVRGLQRAKPLIG
ncbi:MAG: aminodeoxychorismate synthase component I [Hyphomicrobiaceae bacterium]